MYFKNYLSNNSLALDVGANIGAMSEKYSSFFKKVISIEPNISIYKDYNARKSDNVKLLNYAVGEKNKKVSLEYYGYNIGMFRVTKGSNINMITIDSLDINPSFIKIDVEGYELNVLKGAQKTIEKNKPLIYIEYNSEQYAHYGFSDKDLWEFCIKHKYVISGDFSYLKSFASIKDFRQYLAYSPLSNIFLVSRSFYDRKSNI